jgi:hypothetical protein
MSLAPISTAAAEGCRSIASGTNRPRTSGQIIGLYTPDFVVHGSMEVLDAAAEGDMVVTRFISTGTHKGGLSAIPGYQPRIPANGKFIRVPELAVHRVVNDSQSNGNSKTIGPHIFRKA